MYLNCLNVILADAPAAPAAGAAGSTAPVGMSLFNSPIVLMVLLGVMFYFLMIRPQNQRAAQQKKLLASLKAGDKVATAAGIIGVVVTVKDNTVSLRSADAKMEVTKDSITQILEAANSGGSTAA